MSKDPYKYFRIEAHELLEGLGGGLLELEKIADPETIKRLLRQAHTLKGASRVVKRTDIGDLAHQLEDLLSPHRDSDQPVSPSTIDRALELLDEMRRLVASLDRDPADPKASETAPDRRPAAARDSDDQTLRIEVAELDAVLDSASEAHAAATSLLADIEKLDRSLAQRMERVVAELEEVRQAAWELRLVPLHMLASDLERVVRDAARTLGKSVDLSFAGGDTHIDAYVLAGLRKALVHVMRNSVVHGIESAAERARAGKPDTGRIDIAVQRRGHRVRVTCKDDGRGLDLESVTQVALARGLLDPEAAGRLDAVHLGKLLMQGGVSTSTQVTSLSGRGVGLEAVRHAVESLKGEVTLLSSPGRGTTVEFQVPISLSAMPALSMHVGDQQVMIPLDNVQRALRVNSDEISRDSDGEHLIVDDQVIPFVHLGDTLPIARPHRGAAHSAVVIEAEGRMAAIGVDQLGGARSIMMRAIPRRAAAHPVVAGATLDEEGRAQLVLSPPLLISAAMAPTIAPVQTAPAQVPPVLIIDDSLTTRMLEQSILESAGYEVDLAVSAEEGLQKARARRYGIFIVDVEMPGMNGFEFIETIRADPDLHDIPAILVTSRADDEDKRRGMNAGAGGYIVKKEFDQAELLATIKRLVQ